jgi:large subunit ribosomal protein L16
MLVPKRAKYRKQFRGVMRGMAHSGNTLAFGEFGLKALEAGWFTSRQIEAARKTMTHYTERGGRIWIRIFPDKPITKKPLDVRMGSGKGEVVEYVFVVKPGRVLFEMGQIPKALALEALRRASHKLPFMTKIVERKET